MEKGGVFEPPLGGVGSIIDKKKEENWTLTEGGSLAAWGLVWLLGILWYGGLVPVDKIVGFGYDTLEDLGLCLGYMPRLD